MSEKAIDSNASGCLIIIFPIALLMAILFVAWPVLLALVIIGAGLRVWQQYQWQQWSQQVNPFFHKLIQENQGSVTAMDLAMKANLSGTAAKQYLDTKAEEFGAQAREYPDRGTVYYFITASTLGSIFDDSEPPSLYDGDELEEISEDLEAQTDVPSPSLSSSTQNAAHKLGGTAPPTIIQSELAKRLDVHSSTVHKRKFEPDFATWSQSRDPEGIAWKYSPRTKLFSPIETKPKEGDRQDEG